MSTVTMTSSLASVMASLEIMAFMEAAEMSAKRGGEPVTIAEAIEECREKPFWKFW